MGKGLLIDLTKCIGCGACTLACQEINGLPRQETPEKLSATARTAIRQAGGLNIRQQCMHCLDPACVSVCPVTALQKTKEGPVIYDESRCIGCRYCMLACPFNVPKYEWDSRLPTVQKCTMCYETRVKHGLAPACASVCPTGATTFGERDDLIREAEMRIAQHPGRYVDHIYGVREAGGTSVLFLSPVPFADIGFPDGVREEPYPRLTWNILSKIPSTVSIGAVLLIGVHWVIKRRILIERLEKEAEEAAEAKK
jgi:formate dehydrogenase iron-sulfur subunit